MSQYYQNAPGFPTSPSVGDFVLAMSEQTNRKVLGEVTELLPAEDGANIRLVDQLGNFHTAISTNADLISPAGRVI